MKYDTKVLRAIDGSIEKWEKIAFEGGVDRGVENCALCEKYYDNLCVDCSLHEAGLGCLDKGGSFYRKWAEVDINGKVAGRSSENAAIQMLMALYHVREWYKLTAERG